MREYTVQYRETDLAFVTRLLAEQGIFFAFEHPDDDPARRRFEDGERESAERVILGDGPHAYPPIAGPPRLDYRHEAAGRATGMAALEHHGFSFPRRRRV